MSGLIWIFVTVILMAATYRNMGFNSLICFTAGVLCGLLGMLALTSGKKIV